MFAFFVLYSRSPLKPIWAFSSQLKTFKVDSLVALIEIVHRRTYIRSEYRDHKKNSLPILYDKMETFSNIPNKFRISLLWSGTFNGPPYSTNKKITGYFFCKHGILTWDLRHYWTDYVLMSQKKLVKIIEICSEIEVAIL